MKGWAILLIAFGIFAAGIGNGYLAISKKVASDQVKAKAAKYEEELKREEDLKKAKEASAEIPKTWDVLSWDGDRKATITSRYRDLICSFKFTLENFRDGEYLSDITLLDKDGFEIESKNNYLRETEVTIVMSVDDYNRIASVTAKAQLL